jgi:hypothetical protein
MRMVHGTPVQTPFRDRVSSIGRGDLRPEQTYLSGSDARYGTRGAVRIDAGEYDPCGNLIAVYDLKTGSAALTANRIRTIQDNVPLGPNNLPVPVYEIRP